MQSDPTAFCMSRQEYLRLEFLMSYPMSEWAEDKDHEYEVDAIIWRRTIRLSENREADLVIRATDEDHPAYADILLIGLSKYKQERYDISGIQIKHLRHDSSYRLYDGSDEYTVTILIETPAEDLLLLSNLRSIQAYGGSDRASEAFSSIVRIATAPDLRSCEPVTTRPDEALSTLLQLLAEAAPVLGSLSRLLRSHTANEDAVIASSRALVRANRYAEMLTAIRNTYDKTEAYTERLLAFNELVMEEGDIAVRGLVLARLAADVEAELDVSSDELIQRFNDMTDWIMNDEVDFVLNIIKEDKENPS